MAAVYKNFRNTLLLMNYNGVFSSAVFSDCLGGPYGLSFSFTYWYAVEMLTFGFSNEMYLCCVYCVT